MSVSPILALRKAARARLIADAALGAALGGPKIFDEAPRAAEPPYVLFADAQMRDWSALSSRGAEQFLNLTVVSPQRGLGEGLAIAQQIIDLLDEAGLSLAGHALIDLRFVSLDARRDPNGRLARVLILFRATTEYL
jgi:hypothetical protein